MMRTTRNRGFVMAAAVGMIALVGVAAAVTAGYFAYEAQRTRNADIAAQQRQLVMAGMVLTQQWLMDTQGTAAGERMFAVPLAINDASMDLQWKIADARTAETALIVNLHGQRIRQTATWQRDNVGWRVVSTRGERLMDKPLLDHAPQRVDMPEAVNLASP